jgi:hypothetical protein
MNAVTSNSKTNQKTINQQLVLAVISRYWMEEISSESISPNAFNSGDTAAETTVPILIFTDA